MIRDKILFVREAIIPYRGRKVCARAVRTYGKLYYFFNNNTFYLKKHSSQTKTQFYSFPEQIRKKIQYFFRLITFDNVKYSQMTWH